MGSVLLLVLACSLLPGGRDVALAAEGQWARLGPDGGTVTVLAIHPDDPAIVYAGTDAAGVFKTSDGGATWAAVNMGLTNPHIRALGIHPAAPDTLYAGTDGWLAGTGGVLFKTTDAGATWTALSVTATQFIGFAFDARTPNTVYAAADTGLLKTMDGGATWTPVVGPLPYSVALSPDDPDTLYVGMSNGVMKTSDGGATWIPASNGLPQVQVLTLALDPDARDTVYAGMYTSGVFKTTDGGASWVAASNGLPGARVYALALDPTDTGTLYAATSDSGVFKTTDGGGNWAAVNTGLSAGVVLALALHPDTPETVYAGTHGQGVFKTANAAETWIRVNAALRAVEVRALAFDPATPDTLYAGGWGGGGYFAGNTGYGVFKSGDGGASWSTANTGLTSVQVSALAVHPVEPATLYAATALGGGLFKSTDGGASWSLLPTGVTAISSVAVHPVTPDTIYAGGDSGILKSTDGGAGWTPLGGPSVRALAVHPSNPDLVYKGTWYNGVFKSTDGGANWTPVNTGLSNPNLLSLTLDRSAPDTLYAGTDGGGVFKTTDGGGTWTAVNTGLSGGSAYVVAINPFNPGRVYAGTSAGGLFESAYGGETWSPVGTGLSTQGVRAMAFTATGQTALYSGGAGGVATFLQARALMTPLAPSGRIIPTMPTYTWEAVPGATVYRLRVEDSTGPKSVWVDPIIAGCAAGEGTCHFRFPAVLEPGPAHWWVQAAYPDGEGPWGDGLAFTIATTTLGAPTGVSTDPTPTYTWTALPGAAYYYLWVTDSGQAGKIATWYAAAQAGCAGGTGTCRITPTTALDSGPVTWAIQAWNSGGYGAWSPTASFQVDRLPAVPTGRAQRQADGTTPIPLGGTATSRTVVFRATGTDLDAGQKVRLQVEVKPVGTAFTGSVSCYSVLVNSGTPATCQVTGLALGRYHWRVRAKDSLNAVSAWASYATNAESAADFIVSTAPALPTGRGQYQANGTTPIPLGGTATSTTVVFRATVSDPDAGQKVRLQVEARPVGTAFTGAVSCGSALVSSGTATTCAVNGLVRGKSYHWRLRAMDSLGTPGAWVSYATNAESAADFKVAP
jgi:photosystem II stability/assembly factor-like uncharacterized protein